jgi:hypothetical protein
MSWGDAATASSDQNGAGSTTGGFFRVFLGIDAAGSRLFSGMGWNEPTANYAVSLMAPGTAIPSEGYHFTVVSAEVDAGTSLTFYSGYPGVTVYTVQ